MNFLGYLVMLANLENLGSGPLKDISVRVADIGTLANEFKDMSQFNVEKFKESGFYRVDDIGMYMSNNLINYLMNGNANSKDQALMIKLYYGKVPEKPTSTGLDDGTVAFISGKFNDGVMEYLDTQKISERNKRSIEPAGVNNGPQGSAPSSSMSEKIKDYMDHLVIYGRSPATTPDPTKNIKESLIRLKSEITYEKNKLANDMKKVFDEISNYKEEKRIYDLMDKANTNSANL